MNSKTWIRTAVFGFVASVFCSQGLAVSKKWLDYDRLRAIQEFLGAIYPELRDGGGFLTVQTEEFNSHSGPLDLFFIPCWPGSGVPRGGEKPLHPHCNGFIGSVNSEFLHVTVETGTVKFPIHHFYAQGNFFQEKQNASLADMKAHPEWKDPEKLDFLKKAGAKFGPENKESFLKFVPADVIYGFSGCRLQIGTATFGADYGWVVQGTYRQGKKQHPCHASFEPFDGKLIGLDQV